MYELPTELRNLYKHWEKHVNFTQHITKENILDKNLLKEIELFSAERMHVWYGRYIDKKPPYTNDPILDHYRFCNMYRELDRQTIEIHTSLNHLRGDFDLWLLNVAFHRFICKPDTVKEIGLLSYDNNKNMEVYEKLSALPRPKYGSAYIFPISIIQKSEYPTREEFFCLYLPLVMKRVATVIKGLDNVSVPQALEKILPIFGFNFRFHFAEILIDVAYQFPEHIDLYKEFPTGPGSKDTIKRLFKGGKELETYCAELTNYKMNDFPYLSLDKKPILFSAENWEGIGCEFRKYTNLKNGHGRRRLYKK